jgi:plasmid stability protein
MHHSEELGVVMGSGFRVQGSRGGKREIDGFVFLCFCVFVKNLTVTLDEETYRRARIAAAEQGVSVSGLVRDLLAGLRPRDTRAEAVRSALAAMDAVTKFAAGNRFRREELHER